jgi:hypothetical protein
MIGISCRFSFGVRVRPGADVVAASVAKRRREMGHIRNGTSGDLNGTDARDESGFLLRGANPSAAGA